MQSCRADGEREHHQRRRRSVRRERLREPKALHGRSRTPSSFLLPPRPLTTGHPRRSRLASSLTTPARTTSFALTITSTFSAGNVRLLNSLPCSAAESDDACSSIELLSLNPTPDLIEMISWNDYGEVRPHPRPLPLPHSVDSLTRTEPLHGSSERSSSLDLPLRIVLTRGRIGWSRAGEHDLG